MRHLLLLLFVTAVVLLSIHPSFAGSCVATDPGTITVQVTDGTKLAMHTEPLALHALSQSATNILTQATPAKSVLGKTRGKQLRREIVWFGGREADLEKHGFVRNGRVYITLTDLFRHVGGSVNWRASSDKVVVAQRNKVKLRIIPNTATVYVNGKRANLGRSTTRIDERLFVPLRPTLYLLGIETHWNKLKARAEVNTAVK